MKLSLIIEAIDRATAPVSKIVKANKSLGASSQAASTSVGSLGRKISTTAKEGAGAGRALATTASNVANVGRQASRAETGIGRLARQLRVLSRRPSLLIVRTKVDQRALSRFAEGVGRWAGGLGVAIGAGVGTAFAASITLPLTLARAALDAGVRLDKGFASKLTIISKKLSGTWDGFLLKVGKAGVFDFVIAKLTELSAWVDKLAASGQLDKWAKSIAASVIEIGNVIASVNWTAVAADVFEIAKAIGALGKFIAALGGGGLGGLFNVAIVAIIGKIGFALYGLGAALGVVSIAGAPLWLVVGAIAGLAAGAFLVYRNWSSIQAGLSAVWEGIKNRVASAVSAIIAFYGGMWTQIKSAFATGAAMIWNSLPLWLRGIFSGTAFVIRTVAGAISGQTSRASSPSLNRPSAPPLRPLRTGPPVTFSPTQRQAPSARPGNAQVSLHITTDPGVKVRPTKLAANGVDLAVNRGRAMAGAA